MEKKVTMNTRLAVALLFGLLLAGQEAAAARYDDALATDAAAEATPATPSYGKATKAECEVAGTCDVKAAVDPTTRPGAVANPYTRGCSPIHGCRD